MKKIWEDFKKFIKRGNVVDMAVGVAVASAFTAIVTAFTKGFINPLLALISKNSTQEDLKIILREEKIDAVTGEIIQSEVALLWGGFVQAIINFLIVALSLFIVMRIVSGFSNRAKKFSSGVKNLLTDADEKEAAELEAAKIAEEEKAKAEAEEKALEEAKAKAEAEKLAAELLEEENRKKREEALLTEIRDLLKSMNNK
ncbi:MAG: large conductance mechanosensitive channel protein MscL [Clostridia bacterium]|nr:large conductance mechanosensitive channel protein MscL [Clostridia bacterium]